MGFLQIPFHLVDTVFQIQNFLQMLLTVIRKHINGIIGDFNNPMKHFQKLCFCFFAEGNVFFFSQHCWVSSIFCVVTNSFNIIYHMEQTAYIFHIIHRKRALTDFHQIVGNGMVHVINLFLCFINLLYSLILRLHQNIYGICQVLYCNMSHTLQLLCYLYHCGIRWKYTDRTYIFQLKTFLFFPDCLIRHKQVCKFYNPFCKREQDNYLKNFKESMGIRHTSSDIVTGNSAYSGFYPAFSHKQNSCDYNRSHYIKQKMYHCRTLCIFVAADTCQQRCGTRADITA